MPWAGVAALFLAATIQQLWSADTWTLLAMGRWVAENTGVPRVEAWAYTTTGRGIIEPRWLFCLLMHSAWKLGGAAALVALQAAAVGVVFGLIAFTGYRATGWRVLTNPIMPILFALGIFGGASRWVMRPELATYLFLAWFLVVLGRVVRGGPAAKAWWLIPAQVLWVNLHPAFIIGPALIGLAAAGILVDSIFRRRGADPGAGGFGSSQRASSGSRRAGHLALIALAATVCCLMNPYGVAGAVYPLQLLAESQAGHVVSRHITEMRPLIQTPLAQWRWDTWAAACLLTLVIIGSLRRWRSLRFFDAAALLLAVYFFIGPNRNVALAALIATWAGTMRIADDAASEHSRVLSRSRLSGGLSGWAALLTGFLAFALGVMLMADRYWQRYGIDKRFGFGVVWARTAQGAADFVLREQTQPNIYNTLGDGGYLMWRGFQVYVDGRMEVRDEGFWRAYFEGGGESWGGLTQRWGINTAIVPRRGHDWLSGGLAKRPDWALVYVDETHVVFVRDIPEHTALITRHRLDPAASQPDDQ